MRKELFTNTYMTLFDDWTIGLNDWVGYIDDLEKEEVEDLYNALKKYFI